MKIKVSSYSSQSSLFSAIAFFILGALLFTKSETVLSFVSISFGIILTIIAIIQYIFYGMQLKREEEPKRSLIVSGTVFLLLAIIFIFFHNIVEQFIRFIIGAWILFSGIMRFINSLALTKTKKFIPLLIVSILLMGVGIYTIITPDVFIKYIGLIMMIYAAIEIIGYIFYTKDTYVPEEVGTTTLIVSDTKEDKEENKEKDIKEGKVTKTKTSRKKKDKDKNKKNDK